MAMTSNRRPGRSIALVARCGGLVGALAVLVATRAGADSISALTGLVDAAAQRLQIAEPVSASRSAIDALNHTMLTQIAANWELVRSPACAAQLDAARTGVTRARQLDGLYQQALSLATQSYCQP